MMNIFSIFDPTTNYYLSLNWLSMLIMFFLFPFQYWLLPSRFMFFWMKFIKFIFMEFKALINYSYSNIIIFISLLLMILLNNFLGLFPYIFTASSHMSMSLSLSLIFWLSTMLYTIFSYFKILLAHLTPLGTPFILMPFMVIIESISLMIRPLTLSIRLTANMIAGHLLLSLLGSSGQLINNIMIMPILLFSQILLFMLEISVALIQSYVFSILSTLYSSEI
uniref:ATP synthase subunit a n=1 Tax=Myrmica scabrinodis TaxID=207696 RepID=A0A0A8P3D0_9HYME|nr:ATP synthase F0 subunit 6 [Myrmica scabrinodis]CEF49544.1 ATP synthase F0 subunit 6 [Myrmica scabrinodis]